MAEEHTQTTESGGTPAAGSPDTGSSGGGAGGSDRIAQLEAELARERERTRSFQGQADRERANAGALTERLSKVEELMGRFDPEAVADQFTARFNQQQALAAERSKLREEFKAARPEVLDGKYESPEAMRAAVEASHQAESEYRDSIRREEEARILASLKESNPSLVLPTPQTTSGAEGGSGEQGGGGGSGPLTAADLAAMPLNDYLALSDEELAAAQKRL